MKKSNKVTEQTPATTELATIENAAPAIKTMTLDDLKAAECARFTTTPEIIKTLNKKYKGLKIEDENDKAGYEAVRLALQEVRPLRTQIKKDKDVIKARYREVGTALDQRQKQLEDLITPLEDQLQAEKDRIDAIKEAAKQAEKERLDTLERNRVSELLKYCEFDGQFYSVGDSLSLASIDVRGVSDELFNSFIEKAREEKDAQDLKAEALRVAEETRKKEEKAAADKLKADNEALLLKLEEAKEARANGRVMALQAQGYARNEVTKDYQYEENVAGVLVMVSIDDKQIKEMDDAPFYSLLADKNAEFKAMKHGQEEQARKRRRMDGRAEKMTDLGFTFDYVKKEFVIKNESGTLTVAQAFLFDLTDEKYDEWLDGLEQEINELSGKEESRLTAIRVKAEQEATAKAKMIADALPGADKIAAAIAAIRQAVNIEIKEENLAKAYASRASIILEVLQDMDSLVERVKNAAAIQPEATASAN